MSIEELLEQMEQYRSRREHRDVRPEWLKDFVQRMAVLFEPLTNVGRVGYDCQFDERGWTVCMYLGTTEIVGGSRDGQIDHAAFRMDLKAISSLFVTIHRFEWYSLEDSAAVTGTPLKSLICVHGDIAKGETVRLELMALPPQSLRPGLHCRPDGTIYETN